jgi:hypothetical protein
MGKLLLSKLGPQLQSRGKNLRQLVSDSAALIDPEIQAFVVGT